MANKSAGGNGNGRGAPTGSHLYEVLQGIDFEKRELVGKRKGVGLFDLVKEKDGRLRCYACTLCERSCPVDCIEIDHCPEFETLPFDVEAERAAALAAQPEIEMAKFDPVVARIRDGSGLVEAFHATQEAFGWLPRAALEAIADEMKFPFSRVFGVASFYSAVPARAGGQVRHRRLHGHRLPRGRRAAGRRGVRPGTRRSPSATPRPTASSRCRPSTASAPARWRRWCASATRTPTAESGPTRPASWSASCARRR